MQTYIVLQKWNVKPVRELNDDLRKASRTYWLSMNFQKLVDSMSRHYTTQNPQLSFGTTPCAGGFYVIYEKHATMYVFL